MKLKRGSTSVRRLIFVADSSSTTGAGLTGLTYNSASLVWYYFAGDLSNEVQVTLATATLGTWASGGFVEVDPTNMPGWYEIGIPNAALDGGIECAMQLRGAANMVPVNIYIELDSFDYQTATQPVNLTQIGGDTQSATDLKDFADAGYDPTANAVTAVLDSATQSAIADLPTNAELATALTTADDAVLAAIAALNNLSSAQVNAELLDVLNTDTFNELASPPAASSTLAAKLTWLFMWAKNKATETATQRKLYADDGTTVVSTETVGDDGTTFTKGEAS